MWPLNIFITLIIGTVVMAKKDIQEFIAVAFASRDFAHKSHLATKSYAVHMALGSFYDDVIGQIDTIAEIWQGRNGELIGNIPSYDSRPMANPESTLSKHLEELENLRGKLGDCKALQARVDDLCALYLQTLYKLKFLG